MGVAGKDCEVLSGTRCGGSGVRDPRTGRAETERTVAPKSRQYEGAEGPRGGGRTPNQGWFCCRERGPAASGACAPPEGLRAATRGVSPDPVPSRREPLRARELHDAPYPQAVFRNLQHPRSLSRIISWCRVYRVDGRDAWRCGHASSCSVVAHRESLARRPANRGLYWSSQPRANRQMSGNSRVPADPSPLELGRRPQPLPAHRLGGWTVRSAVCGLKAL